MITIQCTDPVCLPSALTQCTDKERLSKTVGTKNKPAKANDPVTHIIQPVILVDTEDRAIGTMEKQRAHETGALHRAISVVIIKNSLQSPEILLQQRQTDKYHCPGLWANACCSHPYPGENVADCATRRLNEELNIHTPLTHCSSFIYRATLDNGLIEHELDHVFLGFFDQPLPEPNPKEVAATRWVDYNILRAELKKEATASTFCPWLAEVIEMTMRHNRYPLQPQKSL